MTIVRQLVYWSGSGVTKRIAEKLGGIPLDEYQGGPFVLMFPSYGAPRTGGHIPPAVEAFTKRYGQKLRGVVGVGNVTFGSEFCYGATLLSRASSTPLLAKIDMVPTGDQLWAIEDYLLKGD